MASQASLDTLTKQIEALLGAVSQMDTRLVRVEGLLLQALSKEAIPISSEAHSSSPSPLATNSTTMIKKSKISIPPLETKSTTPVDRFSNSIYSSAPSSPVLQKRKLRGSSTNPISPCIADQNRKAHIKKLLSESSITIHFMNNYKKIAIINFESDDTLDNVKYQVRKHLDISEEIVLSKSRPGRAGTVELLAENDNETLANIGMKGNQMVYICGLDDFTLPSPSLFNPKIPSITPPKQPKARTTTRKQHSRAPQFDAIGREEIFSPIDNVPFERPASIRREVSILSNLLSDFDLDEKNLLLSPSSPFPEENPATSTLQVPTIRTDKNKDSKAKKKGYRRSMLLPKTKPTESPLPSESASKKKKKRKSKSSSSSEGEEKGRGRSIKKSKEADTSHSIKKSKEADTSRSPLRRARTFTAA